MKYLPGVYYLLFLFFSMAAAGHAAAQAADAASTGIIVHEDPRLAILMKKHRNIQLGVIRSGVGYRVQIYSGTDRNRATAIKINFMRRFPGVRTYLTYVSPHFRVKVGDYLTRQDAEGMYHQVYAIYNPCMIVPDIIVINTLKDD